MKFLPLLLFITIFSCNQSEPANPQNLSDVGNPGIAENQEEETEEEEPRCKTVDEQFNFEEGDYRYVVEQEWDDPTYGVYSMSQGRWLCTYHLNNYGGAYQLAIDVDRDSYCAELDEKILEIEFDGCSTQTICDEDGNCEIYE